jgi:FkbM family methyltransferase
MTILTLRRNASAANSPNIRALINFTSYALLLLIVVVPSLRLIIGLAQHSTPDTDDGGSGSEKPAAKTAYAKEVSSPSHSIEHDERISFQPSSDPLLEPLDCIDLLGSYRKQTIPELKDHTDELPYHKSYLRLTKTDNPFYLSTNDGLVDTVRVDIFKKGFYYEPLLTQAMQTILEEEYDRMPAGVHLPKRPIMVDVGGNVGWFSMLSAAHGAEVYVFEPNVVNMVRLCESAVLNGWSSSSNPVDNQLHPFMKGVSNNHGEEHQMYKVHPRNPGSFTFSEKAAGKDEVPGGLLQLVTLDALAQDQNWLDDDDNTRIAILKIDVEGLELKVFQGAAELLKSGTVKNIFMEWKKGEKKQESEEWEKILSMLLDAGYELYKIGNIPGPKDIVTDKFESGQELMVYLTSTMPIHNANLWIRLSETE